MIAIAVGLAVSMLVLALSAEIARQRKLRLLNSVVNSAYDPGASEYVDRGWSNAINAFVSFEQGAARRSKLLRKIDNRLFSANLRIGVISLGLASLASALILTLVLSLAGMPISAALLSGFVVQPLVLWQVVERRISRRKAQFEREMPEFLLLMSSSLESGLSLLQALESISREGSGEIERQFRRSVREMKMGVKLEVSLRALKERTQSSELTIFIASIETQREVGGNLSEVLELASNTLRERLEVANDLRVLSADGRFSAFFLTLLPIAVFFVFFFFNRSYVEFFWTEPAGLIMAAIFVGLTIIGSIWIRLIVKVRF